MYCVPPVLSPHPECSRAVQPSSRLSRGTPGYKESRVKVYRTKEYYYCTLELTLVTMYGTTTRRHRRLRPPVWD